MAGEAAATDFFAHASGLDAEAIERGRRLFAAPCTFIRGVAGLDQLPEAGPAEVAFAGRSNVGKSSLLNALVGRNDIARTSKTPGRTQQLNFFDLGGGRLLLVDLPGYGFAEAPKARVDEWSRLVRDYLRGRPSLRRAVVLVDARHGLKGNDREFLGLLDRAAVSYLVALTKADLIKPGALAERVAETEAELAKHVAAFPAVAVTSAAKRRGLEELRAHLEALAEPGPRPT
jgi:GTP-binding protein